MERQEWASCPSIDGIGGQARTRKGGKVGSFGLCGRTVRIRRLDHGLVFHDQSQ